MKNYNVLFLTIDCFRFDRVSANGYKRSTTPNLDVFVAEEGINFTQAIAGGPSTMAAFPCLFTSSYPVMYGGTRYLSEERTTIAQVLSKEGYYTIGLSSNPYITPEFCYDRGFNSFWDSVKRTRDRDRKIELLSKVISRDSTLWGILRKMARSSEIRQKKGLYPSASVMNEKILKEISASSDKPFFIWAHYMDIHYPYNFACLDFLPFLNLQPSAKEIADILTKLMKESQVFSEQEKQLVNAIYDASLNYVDQQLGKLFNSLKELKVWDDLIIIVTGDHGEELLERGRFGHGDEGEETLFPEELLHIPFILKMPESSYAGRYVKALISQVDIAPSILDIVGIAIPDNWYGISVLPLLQGEMASIRDFAITQRGIEDSFTMSLRTEEWKLIYNAFSNEEVLLSVEPVSSLSLTKDFSKSNPDIFQELHNLVIDHLRSYKLAYSHERLKGVDLDDDLRKQLHDLGYM